MNLVRHRPRLSFPSCIYFSASSSPQATHTQTQTHILQTKFQSKTHNAKTNWYFGFGGSLLIFRYTKTEIYNNGFLCHIFTSSQFFSLFFIRAAQRYNFHINLLTFFVLFCFLVPSHWYRSLFFQLHNSVDFSRWIGLISQQRPRWTFNGGDAPWSHWTRSRRGTIRSFPQQRRCPLLVR